MLVNIPIESLEERYSKQWNSWFPKEFKRLNINFFTVYGDTLTSKIEDGVFLDVCGTNFFKASQLQQLSSLLHKREIKEGDICFFHDLWFPGLEMLAYIRDGLKVDFKIAGILHAGTYDSYDFITQAGMEKWGSKLEESWFTFVDYIFVATEFHKNLITSCREVSLNKVHVTGLPIYENCVNKRTDKENKVVFPHRLDKEKAPDEFDKLSEKLKKKFPDWEFLKTKDVCNSKQEYYELLTRSKIAVSCAYQETWGIAQQEATFAGCLPVVPNRLSYVELFDPVFRYNSLEEAELLISNMIEMPDGYFPKFFDNYTKLSNRGRSAIEKMTRIMIT